MVLAITLEPLLDAVRDPQQSKLAQRGEVAHSEVVPESGVDLLGGVYVAVRQPSPKRLGAHVDELDLVCGPHHVVRHSLALLHAGDRLDHVVERLQVLDVHSGDDVDAGCEQLVDVLPPLRVPGSRHVGVCELVDDRHLGPAREDAVDVHLLERRPPVVCAPAWHHFETE